MSDTEHTFTLSGLPSNTFICRCPVFHKDRPFSLVKSLV